MHKPSMMKWANDSISIQLYALQHVYGRTPEQSLKHTTETLRSGLDRPLKTAVIHALRQTRSSCALQPFQLCLVGLHNEPCCACCAVVWMWLWLWMCMWMYMCIWTWMRTVCCLDHNKRGQGLKATSGQARCSYACFSDKSKHCIQLASLIDQRTCQRVGIEHCAKIHGCIVINRRCCCHHLQGRGALNCKWQIVAVFRVRHVKCTCMCSLHDHW